jgi:CBS domain containing-hemolysin-like protein
MSSPQPKTLRELVREPHYIPETTTIESLLETMKSQRLHMAIVLDEYGGVAGLVTLEDILEEIVGDIADEFDDHADEQVQRIDDHTLLVDARIHLDELNDLYDLEFPEDGDFDTLAGFVFSELGRIPKQGEVVTWSHLQITVLEATLRKLVRLQLRSTSPWPAESKAKVRV